MSLLKIVSIFQVYKTVFETKIEQQCKIEYKMNCQETIEQKPKITTMHECKTEYEKICKAEYNWVDTGTFSNHRIL